MTPRRHRRTRRGGTLRWLIELVACIGISMTLLKAFLVEGYLISSGSMAPQLLGFHKQITCPKCGFQFARTTGEGGSSREPAVASCLNCGLTGISSSAMPRNEGDQLLVQKLPFLFRPIARWEPIVFRRPGQATLTFVKRVVGLPGETVQIVEGDITIDGRLCRKTLAQQRPLRVPVYDDRFRTAGKPDRWMMEPGWSAGPGRFRFRPTSSGGGLLCYYHQDIDQPGPVRDRYAYNPREPRSRTRPVRDLVVSLLASEQAGVSQWRIELDTGGETVSWIRDLAGRQQSLRLRGRELISATLEPSAGTAPQLLEFSAFDRTLITAQNGQQVFPPQPLSTLAPPLDPYPHPLLQIRADSGTLGLTNIRIDRDVYYRGGGPGSGVDAEGRHVSRTWHLGSDEYFMLGDNSPVSLDSRSWSTPAVPARLLIGRPLLVHLPSRQWRLPFGKSTKYIRIPDLSRIRYIR